ncbi:MAG: ion channel [Cyanobacteria bacterium P01_E01_bin.43]
MLNQLIFASVTIVATLLVQVVFIGMAISRLSALSAWLQSGQTYFKRIVTLLALTLWVLAGLSVAVWIWALLYLALGVFDAIEPAVYFSTVAFTTLGFGDITLSDDWRLTSALMAANGLLLFSLNTAFLIEVVRQLFRQAAADNTAGHKL